VREQLIDYCYRLFQAGALKGDSPGEAYYVKCDAETNPPAGRDVGIVTAELGLAPTTPAEFIVVRITRDIGGATVLSTLQTEGS
jgi:phage tail sheath protein FI